MTNQFEASMQKKTQKTKKLNPLKNHNYLVIFNEDE